MIGAFGWLHSEKWGLSDLGHFALQVGLGLAIGRGGGGTSGEELWLAWF